MGTGLFCLFCLGALFEGQGALQLFSMADGTDFLLFAFDDGAIVVPLLVVAARVAPTRARHHAGTQAVHCIVNIHNVHTDACIY